jgi:hypothetical protein
VADSRSETELSASHLTWGRSASLETASKQKCTVRKTSRFHRRKKTILSVQSQVRVSFTNLPRALTRPPIFAGEIVFSSKKITPA